jgi:DeoR/GlpR family transcriptional regulator of sugar metabolism
MYEKNHAPLFDDVALKRLAAAWNQGASIADLVERFGCARSTIKRQLAALRDRGVELRPVTHDCQPCIRRSKPKPRFDEAAPLHEPVLAIAIKARR